MSPSVKVVLGAIPASFVTLSALMFANFISTTQQKLLLATAVIGTCGLIWSLVGYSRRWAIVVLAMLLIGTAGLAVGGLGGAAAALAIDARNDNLGTPGTLLLRLVGMTWFIVGPVFVGLIQARDAWQSR